MASTAFAGTVVRKALPANATVAVGIVDDRTMVEDELELEMQVVADSKDSRRRLMEVHRYVPHVVGLKAEGMQLVTRRLWVR